MIFESDGRRVYNTDVEGLVSALRRAGLKTATHVLILGTGATARSAVASVRALGAHTVTVVGRHPDRARPVTDLARLLGLRARSLAWGSALPAVDLLISTVTAGAVTAEPTPAGAAALARAAPVIFDAVYDPWPTPLARAAAEAGRTVVNGLDLLIGQALVQIRLMTGADVDAEVLYRAGRAALSDPSHGAEPSVSA
jgi:shikimate dehydrogenase